jgi:hypothetical protein
MLLTEVVVARRGPAGEIAAGICLLDLDCLGVKNAFASLLSQTDYEYMKSRLATPKVAVGLDLAAKVIGAGIDYATELGFEPHPDFAEMEPLLAGAQPALCDVRVRVGGDDGKPLYVAGPNDDVEAIMAVLTRRLGSDGFRFLAPVAGDVALDAFPGEEPEEWEPEQLESIDDVRLVEPMSVASANHWLSSWARRLGIA